MEDRNRLKQPISSRTAAMDFTHAANPLGASEKAKNALRKAVKRVGVSPDVELAKLGRIIEQAEYIASENILFAGGTRSLLYAASKITASNIITPDPLSTNYCSILPENHINLSNAIIKNDNGFAYDHQALIGALRVYKQSVFVLPYPHNVTGGSFSFDHLCRIIMESEQSGNTILLDESYREFSRNKSPVHEIINSARSIILRTFSVYYGMAGLPLAYAIGPAEFIREMRLHVPCSEFNIFAPAAAVASLKDKLYPERTLRFIQSEKAYMTRALQLMNVPYVDTPCPFLILVFDENPEWMKTIFSRYRISLDESFQHENIFYLRVPVKLHKANAAFLKTLRNAISSGER